MLRFVDRVLRIAALLLFGLFVVLALPRLAELAWVRIDGALRYAPVTPAEARRQVLGPEVAAAYDRLRQAIPREGEYVLIEGADPREGSIFWVRYELAPRKALFLGSWEQLRASGDLLQLWPSGVRYAVVSGPKGHPPVLLEQGDLVAALERSHAP